MVDTNIVAVGGEVFEVVYEVLGILEEKYQYLSCKWVKVIGNKINWVKVKQ